MLKILFCFLTITNIYLCLSNTLQWNIKNQFKYTGYIYTDSKVAVIDPVLQVLLTNGEEICNFHLEKSQFNKETVDSNPFRAVVKSAHLGLGELELLPNIKLHNQTNVIYNLIIKAEACHNPDSWTEPVEISIKVLDPPGPLWTKTSYSASINNDVIIGSFVVKVTAYLPPLADPDNKICHYFIEQSQNSSFAIDGSGTISTRKNLLNVEAVFVTLEVTAEDCSQPTHRQSKVKVFVTINTTCKFGWIGFYKLFQYLSGSGVTPIGKKLEFHYCNNKSQSGFSGLIDKCRTKKQFRVTVSVELKTHYLPTADSKVNEIDVCYLDYESLKLQRKICDINDNKLVDILTILSKQKTGVSKFPLQTNMFPGLSLDEEDKFSIYFWMRRKTPEEKFEEFIMCHLNDSGNVLFSVSIFLCNIRIYLHSYSEINTGFQLNQTQLVRWEFNLPQICDDKWHHYLFHIHKSQEKFSNSIRVSVDGETTEAKSKSHFNNIEGVKISRLFDKYNVFIGQCTRTGERKFKGYLAGLTYLPNILVKSSNIRCLLKCMERLHFDGMNQMNPGMSVSLNSEMQTIIINGHNVEEVGKLVEDIGYANPKWNPIPGPRIIAIKTDMLCNEKSFNIPKEEITVNVTMKANIFTNHQLITSIRLLPKSTDINIDNTNNLQSNTGIGIGLFENTTLQVMAIPQSTSENFSEDALSISRCILSIHPQLIVGKEYVEWPQQAIETIKTDKQSIEVRNSSKKIIFFGDFNQHIYQFIIEHLRYFSSFLPVINRKFHLQCSTDVGTSIVNSNILVVKVSASKQKETTTTMLINSSSKQSFFWNDSKKSVHRAAFMRAHSNAAKLSEIDNNQKINKAKFITPMKVNKSIYNYLLGIGIFILICSFILMTRKIRKSRNGYNHRLPFKVVDCICLPLQSIKEKIKPSSLVRVELSKDFLNRSTVKRRDIGLEMQWDDAELKPDMKYHIIENPIYGKSDHEFDDNYLNNDIPPICENEDFTTDEDTDEEIDYEINEQNSNRKESIMKQRLIEL